MRLRPDDENVFRHSRSDVSYGRREPVHKSGTLIPNIHRRDELRAVATTDAELLLEINAAPWKMHVGRKRREQDQIDVCVLETRSADRVFAREEGEIARLDAWLTEAALFDPPAPRREVQVRVVGL
jgi:hypothetical protein